VAVILEVCNGAKPCPHLAAVGATPFCKAFRLPVADVQRCGPKLVKAALKKQKLDKKLKGKHQ
jgi:hypothetical protein